MGKVTSQRKLRMLQQRVTLKCLGRIKLNSVTTANNSHFIKKKKKTPTKYKKIKFIIFKLS